MAFHLSVMPEQAIIRSADASKPTKRRVDDTNHPKVVLDFDSGATQYAYFRLPLPPQDETGAFDSDARLDIQYVSASALTGNVQFGVKYAIVDLAEGQDKVLSSEVASTTSSYTGSANTHYGASFTLTGIFSGLDITKRYVLVLQLTRKVPASDLSADIRVVGGILRLSNNATNETQPLALTGNGDSIPDFLDLWKFNGDLTSESGLSDLTASAATWRIGKSLWGHALKVGSAGYLYDNTANKARLRLTGDMTFFAIVRFISLTSGNDFIVTVGEGAPDTEPNNAQWGLYIDSAGRLVYAHESGAGSNEVVTSTNTLFTLGEIQEPIAIGFIREGTTIKLMIDAVKIDEGSFTNAPTGGSNTELTVGASNITTPGDYCNMEISAMGVIDSAVSEEVYKKIVRRLAPSIVPY